ncbi:MAG: DoxX family protein [FCB group bacterium]|nr:DoxX family protein [FCB group bacterium]
MNSINNLGKYAHWLVRLSLFGIFIYHGWVKFPMAQGLADMMKMPLFMIYVLASMEVAGAILILVGGFGQDLATRIAGLIFTIVMLGAIYKVHWQYGWNSINTGSGNMGMGMEFQVLILAVSLFFATKGNSIAES